MGSVPPSLNLSFPSKPAQINPNQLLNLFKSQQKYLNFSFQNLDLSQTLAFTETLLNAKDTIFFSGVGKSGFVAQKICQTLVSLGIRSGFLSPLDALHGDIGILSPSDILVLLSKSGNTDELLRLVPCARAKGVYLISVTSTTSNSLGIVPFRFGAVTSTAFQMVFGDTVAIALMSAKNLTRDEYATNHPAGRIGKSLIFKVKDVMRKQDELPVCKEGDLIMDQLVELSSKACGCTFTDGDLRRTLKAYGEGIFKLTVGQMCNRNLRTIGPEAMAVEALQMMESPQSPVQFLPVISHQNILIGIITLHGLVSAGL
ncbi:Arabinose-5-phosphate isomerase [Bertholletia excelsa]